MQNTKVMMNQMRFRVRMATAAVIGCALAVLPAVAWAEESGKERASGEDRPIVPDPIVDLRRKAFEKWEALARAADTNGDAVLTQGEWPAGKLAAAVPELVGIKFEACDRDGNGRVDRSEVEWLFDVTFGLVRPDGRPLRTPHGTVLDWSYIRGMDADRDGYLAREEFVSRYHAGRDKSAVIFVERDTDHDGRLSDDEMAPIFWWDIAGNFRGADKNKDGFLTDAEMTQSVGGWGKSLAERTVAAFDGDGDGKLSLAEYRESTFGNPLTDLHLKRQDTDNDGRLSFEEFDHDSPPLLLALHRHFFSHFDLDKDGFLSLAEFDFSVDFTKSALDAAFHAQDRDRDDKLVFAEVFADREPIGDPAATALYQKRLARATDQFNENDRDRDGFLDRDEFSAWRRAGAEAAARRAGERARQRLAEEFAGLDEDHDGQLALKELIAKQPDNARPRLKQQFVVLDFDRSATLSVDEFVAAPGKLPVEQRGTVPDPIEQLRDAAFEKWRTIFMAADRDGDGVLTKRQWPEAEIAESIPALADVTFAMFDRDGNGRVDTSEAEWLFDVVFGLARPDGRPLRTPRGTALDWSYIRKMDTDRDGYVSRDEFVKGYHPGPKKSAEIFSQRDLDHDGRLNDDEMDAFFWWDVVSIFLDKDKDMDGFVTDAEMTQSVGAWGKSLAERTVAAFDGNGDGKLSLTEYRESTFGSPLTDLAKVRQDIDNDGRLSFEEFYRESPPLLLALYRHFFSHFDLDKDGFLSLREFKFNIDYDKVKPEVIFAVKDLDGDGKLVFAEFFTEKKPAKPDARELDRYEMRLARAEDRFRADDRDASGYLDLDEMTQQQEATMEAARRNSTVLSNRKTMLEGNYWVRKGVLVVNEIVFLAIVWMVVRKTAHKQRAMSNEQ